MLKHLDVLATVTDLTSRGTKNTTPDSEAAAATATATRGEKGAAENDYNEAKEEEEKVVLLEGAAAPPTVSVVSKEQAMQLLKPGRAAGNRKRSRSRSKSKEAGNGDLKSEAEAETGTEDSSLEGKFVDLVDLLLPVPIKGEFDVNKIKSSLYFFS